MLSLRPGSILLAWQAKCHVLLILQPRHQLRHDTLPSYGPSHLIADIFVEDLEQQGNPDKTISSLYCHKPRSWAWTGARCPASWEKEERWDSLVSSHDRSRHRRRYTRQTASLNRNNLLISSQPRQTSIVWNWRVNLLFNPPIYVLVNLQILIKLNKLHQANNLN